MEDHMRLAIGYMDGDGTAEVVAAVQWKGFCGSSSAWFGIAQLEKFADRLMAYPLPADDPPIIRGGFWSKEVRGELDQLHVALRVYPVGLRGIIGCLVSLRTPLNDCDKTKVTSSVEVELRTSYQALSDFSQQLKKLLRSEVSEAILPSVAM
jgi:hypothetical protein